MCPPFCIKSKSYTTSSLVTLSVKPSIISFFSSSIKSITCGNSSFAFSLTLTLGGILSKTVPSVALINDCEPFSYE